MTNSLQLSLHFNTCSMEEKAGLQRNSVLQFRTTFRRIFGLNCVFYRISIKIAGLVLRLGTLWTRPPNLLFSGPKTGHRPGQKYSARHLQWRSDHSSSATTTHHSDPRLHTTLQNVNPRPCGLPLIWFQADINPLSSRMFHLEQNVSIEH